MQAIKTKWDLNPLKSGNFEKDRKSIEDCSYAFIDKWKNRKDYLSDPKVLAEALAEYEKWAETWGTSGNEGYYFGLIEALDQENKEIKAAVNKIEDFAIKIGNDIEFFLHNISKIPEKEQKLFLDAEGLSKYKHFLKKLFEAAKYILSEKEEQLLNLKASGAFYDWVSMTSEFLSKETEEITKESGDRETKSFSEIISLVSSPNKQVRDEAAEKVNEILEKHCDVAEHELNAALKDKKVNDSLRGYEKPEQARLMADDIDFGVVDSLVTSVENKFDISHNYYKLKSKLLGVGKLNYFEKTVLYGTVEKKYSFEDSVELMRKVFSKLDPYFTATFEELLANGQYDVFPKKGKSSGAFCTMGKKNQPIYILLNHTNKLRDVLTIAHETGHAFHHKLTKENQSEVYRNISLATAEVASTFVEDFVLQEVLENADDRLKLEIYMMQLDSEVSTIQRQIACYLFEQRLHRYYRDKGYLSKEFIGSLFHDHMTAYLGDFVEFPKKAENWWIYWSHIRNFFYVYSYANGLLISKSLQNSVKKDPKYIENVIEFMKAGNSKSPKKIFLDSGIDIANKSFWNKGLSEQQNLLEKTERLAKEMGLL